MLLRWKRGNRRGAALLFLAALALLGYAGPGPALADTPSYLTDEAPNPGSAYERPTPMGEFLQRQVPANRGLDFGRHFERSAPFWRDSKVNLGLRSFVFYRDDESRGLGRDWALGARLEYVSGWLAERLQVGATLYTTQPLYAPDNDLPTLLLSPEGGGITVLGQAFVRFRLVERTNLRLFRQTFDLPFVNRRDNRMIPNTFEAYSLVSRTWSKCNFILSHVTRMKKREASNFVSMSEAAGATGSNEGLSMGGILIAPLPDFKFGFITQYAWQVMNTFYAEADYQMKLGALESKLSVQYSDQRSVGDQLLGDFTTNFWGAQINASLGGAVLSLAYTDVDDRAGVSNPFGGYPGFTSLIVQSFNRAGEKTWSVGLSYDLARLGLTGCSAFANFAHGDTPDSGPQASPDQNELDLTLDYQPKQGLLKGFWLRLRGAHVDQSGPGASDIQEYQLILNYNLSLL